MSNLKILSNSIRTLDNLYSLNDLHRASGDQIKHRPSLFIRNEQAKALISEIESSNNELSTKTILAYKSFKGGLNAGVWACKELVIAYAAWISPTFHLVVLRAFLNQIENPKQLELPKPEKRYTVELTEYEINQLAWLEFSHKQMNDLLGDLLKPLEMIGSRYTGIVHSHHYEYKRHYKECLNCIKRMIEPFKHDQDIGWTRINRHLNKPEF